MFEKRIFWDVNFETLDYDKKATFVIERVFELGDVEDIRQCRRYYGDDKVTEVFLNAKSCPKEGFTWRQLLLTNLSLNSDVIL